MLPRMLINRDQKPTIASRRPRVCRCCFSRIVFMIAVDLRQREKRRHHHSTAATNYNSRATAVAPCHEFVLLSQPQDLYRNDNKKQQERTETTTHGTRCRPHRQLLHQLHGLTFLGEVIVVEAHRVQVRQPGHALDEVGQPHHRNPRGREVDRREGTPQVPLHRPADGPHASVSDAVPGKPQVAQAGVAWCDKKAHAAAAGVHDGRHGSCCEGK